MRRIRIVAVGLILLSLAGSPMIVAAGSPSFDVYVPENIVEPGEETTVDLEIRNGASPEDDDSDAGETPETEARDVTVSLEPVDGGEGNESPIEVKTNETPLQTMPAQTLVSEGFTIAVDENATAGTYELEAEIEYEYSSSGDDRTSTDTETVELIVEERARFDAVDVTSDLVVGDRGLVSLELENTGVENASDAIVRFDSPDENLQTIQPTTDESELQTAGSEEYVGEWDVNETATVAAAMELADDAVARTYPVSVTVQFRDETGVDQTSRELRVGAATSPEQSFALENVTSDLHVAEDGTVAGTVTNEGPHPVESAVLVLDDDDDEFVPDFEDGLGSGSNVYPRETQYAVGDLEPGESAPFEFRLGIGAEAEPGPRVAELDVRYRNVYDDVRTTPEPLDLPLEVGPERDEFAIEPADADDAVYEPGERKAIELVVTNRKDETVTDVEAKLYTNDPLENHDDEGFVPALEPGESATVAFEVSVADDAPAQTYPLRLDFRYDDERSNSQLTDTYRVPLAVEEPEESGPSTAWLLAGAGLLVAVAGAGWWFREELVARLEGVPGLERLPDLERVRERVPGLDGSRRSSRSSGSRSSAGSGLSGGRAVNRHASGGDGDADGGTATAFDEDDLFDEAIPDDADEDDAGEDADETPVDATDDESVSTIDGDGER